MVEHVQLCCLTLEEMETKKAEEYDPGNKQVFGDITLPGSPGGTNYTLVFMLEGKAWLLYL